MELARRDLIATGAAAATLAAVPPGGPHEAAAAAPLAGAQAPGFYRFKVGEIEVTTIHDGLFQRPLDAGFVKNAELSAVQAALAAAFQPTTTLTIPITTTVVNTGRRLVLLDAGTGGLLSPAATSWMTNFKAAGFAPEQVDTIVISHFHGDHIQGIRAKDGAAVFPNAEIMVPEAEWAFWMDDARMAQAPEAMKGAFQGVRRVFAPIAGEVKRYGGTAELVTGITPVPAHGHTPGHTAFVVASGADRLLVLGDTTNKPELFVRNPDWQAVFDMDATAATATRRRLLDMAAAERMRITGYHYPFPATGFIVKDGGGFAFVPSFWSL
jgi:glyoxylase-like metal-dependent hydrolase (beta-lactamase superfamily II)